MIDHITCTTGSIGRNENNIGLASLRIGHKVPNVGTLLHIKGTSTVVDNLTSLVQSNPLQALIGNTHSSCPAIATLEESGRGLSRLTDVKLETNLLAWLSSEWTIHKHTLSSCHQSETLPRFNSTRDQHLKRLKLRRRFFPLFAKRLSFRWWAINGGSICYARILQLNANGGSWSSCWRARHRNFTAMYAYVKRLSWTNARRNGDIHKIIRGFLSLSSRRHRNLNGLSPTTICWTPNAHQSRSSIYLKLFPRFDPRGNSHSKCNLISSHALNTRSFTHGYLRRHLCRRRWGGSRGRSGSLRLFIAVLLPPPHYADIYHCRR
mmetsp:Transcript_16572/g.24469  ORF Transcript_16572/g.24469 Transcript_16572/m.24469 type:complete len:321 (-) Transcript_16572:228-1190(-)